MPPLGCAWLATREFAHVRLKTAVFQVNDLSTEAVSFAQNVYEGPSSKMERPGRFILTSYALESPGHS